MNNNRSSKNGFSIIAYNSRCDFNYSYKCRIFFIANRIKGEQNRWDSDGYLNGRINDTLDFILDEVKSSKRIIDDEKEISNLIKTVISLVIVSSSWYKSSRSSLVKSDYDPEGDQFTLNQVECPIVYSLRPRVNNSKNLFFDKIWTPI